METIIDKIFSSKKSIIEQKTYFSLMLTKYSNEMDKIKFLMIILEKTLHNIENSEVITFFFIIYKYYL